MFTDIFIKRPVFASVVSLLILLMGLSALYNLQIREYPFMNNTLITVTTSYPGADADLIAGFITTPLESALASAEGIDYMTSSSVNSVSTITINVRLNFNPQVAFTEVLSKVQQTINLLPPQSQLPVVIKTSDVATPLMYISLASEAMTPEQITDYAIRVIKPQFETIDGVAKAEIIGGFTYSMRAFLDSVRMSALGVTPEEVYLVLAKNNYLTAAGSTKGNYISVNIAAKTNLTNADEFKNLIIKSTKNSIIRLKDVANVVLGSQNYDSSVTFDTHKAILLALTPTPSANPISVNAQARAAFPALQKEFPPALTGSIVYDATKYIQASINDVIKTIVEASLIVILVIFLFLGSIRTVFIPIVTIPLSLIGVCSLMLALGYSINLLTLLAFVLAIGLVVDDAIVVVENIHRHMEAGLTRFEAAILGAREIALPVIAMTITLAAVYAPIGFMQGLTGSLFKEFAFTLASSVLISGIIALTLSPMMCSLLLTTTGSKKFSNYIDSKFEKLKTRYQRILHWLLLDPSIILVLIGTILVVLPYLYLNTPRETAPEEDRGFFMVVGSVPTTATLNYITAFTNLYNDIFAGFKDTAHAIVINTAQPHAGLVLKPWNERGPQKAMKQPLQKQLDTITGIKSFAVVPPALPGGGGGPQVQVVIKTTNDFETLKDLSDKIQDNALKSGLFIFLDNTLKFNNPQYEINIHRSKAADLGLDMQSLGSSLSAALSGGYVNYFNLFGRSYQVIPQLERRFRASPQQLGEIYVKTDNGTMVPMSTITTIKQKTAPNSLTHFQQLNSTTLQAVMAPGYTLGQGLAFLQQQANKILPKGYLLDYAGQSRQYVQEGSRLVIIALLSILVIFLVLSAQYESFRDPLIILISVPMSICGALIPLNLGFATINIFTQIGLITLIGLISKHGILIVDFANHLQRSKQIDKRQAVEEAATIRLRPILMTTAAMIAGVIPLLITKGPGSVSRFDIGLVIAFGLLIGTCFTLFVVPSMYYYLASDHKHEKF